MLVLLPPCAEVDLRCGAYVCVQASAPKEADTNADPSRFEPPSASESLKAENNKAMVVKDLVKRFKTPDGVKTAVNHLSVTMYEDEIFALLGHNGMVLRSAEYCTWLWYADSCPLLCYALILQVPARQPPSPCSPA